MARPPFIAQLQQKWNEGKFVCVGIDPDNDRIPAHIEPHDNDAIGQRVFNFSRSIIDATHDLVCAYKPNSAFYDNLGAQGWDALAQTIEYLHTQYPDVPFILDTKRADIGKTNQVHAQAILARLNCDALTVNSQYFGGDTLTPFSAHTGRGVILMCKTSNPGAQEIQDLPIDLSEAVNEGLLSSEEKEELGHILKGRQPKVHELVAFFAARRWNASGNIGLVVGATHPETFITIRKLAGDLPLLIPGIGAQGGDLEQTLTYAADSRGQGMLINSTSSITFASSGKDYAEAARAKTLELHDQITQILQRSATTRSGLE